MSSYSDVSNEHTHADTDAKKRVSSDSICSVAAAAHGKMRKSQGHSPAILVHDSRILQVTLFGTLQKNLSALDFSLLLRDVMTIADEVNSQLTQAMDSYIGVVGSAAAVQRKQAARQGRTMYRCPSRDR
jgi:hypothetical protein